MFNKNFYPTPVEVIQRMTNSITIQGKRFLEPSAGKGDIVDYLLSEQAEQVIACEMNDDLRTIVASKVPVIESDFFKVTADKISHIDCIVMNPPFDEAAKHILHAWEIAPGGCQIIALCNTDTIYNDCYKERRKLNTIIDDYGNSETLGDVFSTAERKTDVEVDIITLSKPKTGSNEFEGFFLNDDPEEEQANAIMPFNSVRNVVQRYIGAVKLYDEHIIVAEKMNALTSLFKVGTFSFHMEYQKEVMTREDFKKGLQKKAWKYLFDTMNLNKYVTSGVMKDINTFVETQTKIPFTMQNIYKMFEIIVGTRHETFNRSLVEAIDKYTMHTHENRYSVEGWKTNAGHMLNKKFIVDYMVEPSYRDANVMTTTISNYSDRLTDLIKVMCNLTGRDYNKETYLSDFIRNLNCEFGKWYSWSFFEIKGFKKGTLHIKFQNEKDWEILNRAYAKIKGQVLPEKMI